MSSKKYRARSIPQKVVIFAMRQADMNEHELALADQAHGGRAAADCVRCTAACWIAPNTAAWIEKITTEGWTKEDAAASIGEAAASLLEAEGILAAAQPHAEVVCNRCVTAGDRKLMAEQRALRDGAIPWVPGGVKYRERMDAGLDLYQRRRN